MKAGLYLIAFLIIQPIAIYAQGPHGLNYQLSDSLICKGDSAFITIMGCSDARIYPSASVTWQDSAHAYLHPDTSTTYIVTGSDNGPQQDTSYIAIAVSKLRVNITAGNILCHGGQATVIVNGANGLPPYAGNGIYAAPAGKQVFSITDFEGCTASDSVIITEPSALTPNENVGSIPCFGDSATVIITATGGTPPYTGTGVHFAKAGSYTYIVTDSNGCNTPLTVSLTQPQAVFMQVIANPIRCYGDSSTVVITAFGGTPQYTGTGTFTEGPGPHYFVVSDLNGCFTSDSVTINQPAPISVNITSDTNRVCTGDTITICATADFVSYFWNSGDTGACIHATQAGNYYVTATDQNNCSVQSNHLSLTIFTPPSVSVKISGDTLTAYNATAYQWYVNESPIPGATSDMYIGHIGQEYQVLVIDTNGCSAFSSGLGIIGGFAAIDDNAVKIYPNPIGRDGFELHMDDELGTCMVEVFNSDGQCVYKNEVNATIVHISFEAATGIYWMKLTSPKGILVKQLARN